jgi:hypothetical protein
LTDLLLRTPVYLHFTCSRVCVTSVFIQPTLRALITIHSLQPLTKQTHARPARPRSITQAPPHSLQPCLAQMSRLVHNFTTSPCPPTPTSGSISNAIYRSLFQRPRQLPSPVENHSFGAALSWRIWSKQTNRGKRSRRPRWRNSASPRSLGPRYLGYVTLLIFFGC